MSETKQITPDRMEQYFNGFSKRFLQKENRTADVEVLGMDLGDQIEGEGVRLIGITYEPNTRELEVELETGDLRSFKPKEVWAIEEGEARVMARRLARAAGIFAGVSSALNVVAALRLAEERGPGQTVATVAVDTGLKYLTGDLFES